MTAREVQEMLRLLRQSAHAGSRNIEQEIIASSTVGKTEANVLTRFNDDDRQAMPALSK